MYNYRGKIINIYDADTMTVVFDLGFKVKLELRVRLSDIDTPELRTKNLKEKKLGYEARDFVRELCLDKSFEFRTYKDKSGKFGRYLCELMLEPTSSLNDLLIFKGYAKVYSGGKKEEWDL